MRRACVETSVAAELPGDQVVNAPREIGLITSVTDFTALLLPCMYEKRRQSRLWSNFGLHPPAHLAAVRTGCLTHPPHPFSAIPTEIISTSDV